MSKVDFDLADARLALPHEPRHLHDARASRRSGRCRSPTATRTSRVPRGVGGVRQGRHGRLRPPLAARVASGLGPTRSRPWDRRGRGRPRQARLAGWRRPVASPAMPNRLADETSPYLLQHATTRSTGTRGARRRCARRASEDRPILLSIGYSACHWCHVMERESFEDPETAAYMNEHFVPIKVDREERPDVDAIYMEAVQAMTGHGGWPLTAFCDPDGVPVLRRHLLPARAAARACRAFGRCWRRSSQAWGERARARSAAPRERIREQLLGVGRLEAGRASRSAEACSASAAEALRAPGGHAPRRLRRRAEVPARRSALELLLARGRRRDARRAARSTRWPRGGIYDQVGGGFARYSVDASGSSPTSRRCSTTTRCSPAPTCTAGRRSATSAAGGSACETLDWALREMRGPEGGFYSALDADSEGVEGSSTSGRRSEVRAALDAAGLAERAARRSTGTGSAEARQLRGPNVAPPARRGPTPSPARLARVRASAAARASGRVRPGLDDKRLASWNALMIAALAEAGAVLERDDYLDAARDVRRVRLVEMRDDADACCAPGRTAKRGSTPTSRTTPTCSRRC